MISGEHLEIKHALMGALTDTANLATDLGMITLATDLTSTRIPKLHDERFALVVLGEFNHGKSTFVNALCGAAILPAGITPTTATINHLMWAKEPRAKAHLLDDTEQEFDPKKLAEWVTIEGREASHVKYVEIGWPADILKEKVTLVDTPGVNDINEQRAEITYSYIPRADAVIFLLDGAQVLKQSERAFLEQRILRRSKDKLIFVLGKIDLLAPDEREEALRYCRQHLGEVVDRAGAVPRLRQARALQRSGAKGGVGHGAAGRAPHERYLADERGRVLPRQRRRRRASHHRLPEAKPRHQAPLAVAGAGRAGDAHSARAPAARRHARQPARHARQDSRRVRSHQGRHAARPGGVRQTVPRAASGGDRPRQRRRGAALSSTVHSDTWKSWAEEEGEKIAAQLERLAEEIIQVTNENVSEVMALLSRELGPADAKVDLEVDTLSYDVGVFALGALGTGIFLFVNSLVGGVLTLAAPILAVVLKERASGQIKAQAKKNAPEVIQRAAEAVRPRFEQIIEDFQARLADFVTAAGDALHKGIGEVLDRALAERRSQGVDTEARTQEIVVQLDRLSAIEANLAQAERTVVGIFDRLDRLADQLGDLIVPDDVREHVELGAAYLERGDLESAIHELSLATELRPDHPRASYLLGVAYARRADDTRAIEALSRAAAVRGGFAEGAGGAGRGLPPSRRFGRRGRRLSRRARPGHRRQRHSRRGLSRPRRGLSRHPSPRQSGA